jgi:hypothetical protein
MESFKASTQYGDWKGTAAADGADARALHSYLEEKKLIKEGEFLVAVSPYTGEHDFVSISAFVFENGDEFQSVKDAIKTINGQFLCAALT